MRYGIHKSSYSSMQMHRAIRNDVSESLSNVKWYLTAANVPWGDVGRELEGIKSELNAMLLDFADELELRYGPE